MDPFERSRLLADHQVRVRDRFYGLCLRIQEKDVDRETLDQFCDAYLIYLEATERSLRAMMEAVRLDTLGIKVGLRDGDRLGLTLEQARAMALAAFDGGSSAARSLEQRAREDLGTGKGD